MISRCVSQYERFFLDTHCMVQVVFRLAEPKYVPILVDDFISKIDGFYIKSDNKDLILHKNRPPVHKIPAQIESVYDASEWMFKHHTPPVSESLGSIAAKDDMVILSLNHLCCDGKYISRIISHIGKKEEVQHRLPTTVFELFSEKLKYYNKDDPQAYCDPNVTRLFAKHPELTDPNDGISRKIFFNIPIKELKNFDHGNNKMKALSEDIWMSLILAIGAYNGKLDKIGCATTVDLRQFLPKGKDNWSLSNTFSNVPVYGRCNYDLPIREIEKDLRESLRQKEKNEDYLAHLKASLEGKRYPPLPGMGAETSNVGMNVIKWPIIDMFGTLNVQGNGAPGHISLINSSLKSLDRNGYVNENKLQCQLLYRRNELCDMEANKLEKSINYILKNISRNELLGSALEKIQKYQQSIHENI